MTLRTSLTTGRGRIRDVVPNIRIGDWQPGAKNGLTDVPGVLVHTQEITDGSGAVNTGVTTILPRRDWLGSACHAGIFRFNGAGEITGSHWIAETGLLSSPVVLTNTFSVGAGYQGVYQYAAEEHKRKRKEGDVDVDFGIDSLLLPVVAETFDGYLSDAAAFAVTPAHVLRGIAGASADPVPEGNRGGGNGMICQGFKGGTGTSSRVLPGFATEDAKEERAYTVAALVQANYGATRSLHVAGVPVGRLLLAERERSSSVAGPSEADAAKAAKDGSIIVVLATNAPLHPLQCQRLAKRAAVGLARVGGYGYNHSGDIFLAFSTAAAVPATMGKVDGLRPLPRAVAALDDQSIDGLFEAAADATEEAIYNALCMAETMTGWLGHTIEALPLDKLREIMARYMPDV